MPGPYFPGQHPASCGHYHPDVLRLRDEKRDDGTFVRIIDCVYCGRYERRLDPRTMEPAIVRRLNKTGVDVGVREEDIPEVRKREMKRVLSIR